MKALVYLISYLMLVVQTNSYKILGIFPHPGASHFDAFSPLLKTLAEKGHELTVISNFPIKEPKKNYRDISLRGTMTIWRQILDLKDFDYPPYLEMPMRNHHMLSLLTAIGHETCKIMTANEEVLRLQEKQFDLAIIEQFNSDCGLALIHKLKIPYIGISSHVLMSWAADRIGMLNNPAFVTDVYSKAGTKRTFMQTFESALTHIYAKFAHYYMSQIPDHRFLTKYYGDDLPDLESIGRNMSLLLINSYFPLTGAHPIPSNVIEIGGVHLKKPSKLPPDLQKYLDESKEGFILFCMGSMIKATSWPEDKLKAFKEAFAEIPYRVLWKWDNDTMEGVPKNVKLLNWIPQFDILQHPNIKGFIAHGGMLGIIEAVHTGIPTMMIPMYGDQFNNAVCAQESGLGVVMGYKNITTESIRWGIKEILSPRIQESAKKLSTVWRDRPQSPMDTAIYWIEHVARNGGKHLRSASADLPLYRYLLLDVIALLSIILLIVFFLVYKLLMCCCRRSSKSKHKKE